jgi:hypothetical protein
MNPAPPASARIADASAAAMRTSEPPVTVAFPVTCASAPAVTEFFENEPPAAKSSAPAPPSEKASMSTPVVAVIRIASPVMVVPAPVA